jgi:hypothetical protein
MLGSIRDRDSMVFLYDDTTNGLRMNTIRNYIPRK